MKAGDANHDGHERRVACSGPATFRHSARSTAEGTGSVPSSRRKSDPLLVPSGAYGFSAPFNVEFVYALISGKGESTKFSSKIAWRASDRQGDA